MKRSLLILGFLLVLIGCGLGPDMSKDRVPRPPSPTPFVPERPIAEYMSEGRAAYASGNFSEAVNSYKRAFDIEQREHRLEKKDLHELLKNLGLSYSRIGDSKNARLIAAYGLSKEYGYPIYHYVLACTYGDEGIEANALYHLQTMYSLRGKLPAGEKLPDPLSENCFASFSDSETFKKGIATMKHSKGQ